MGELANNIDASLDFLRQQIIHAPDLALLDLIENGWEDFYAELYGRKFIDALDSLETGDHHHSEALEWHWEARLALLRGSRPPGGYFSYFPTWSRGNMKTTLGRCMLRTDALLSYAFGQGGYALIPGGTKNKVKGTAMSVERSLRDPQILKYCPGLGRRATTAFGQSRGWTSDFIATEAGYVFHFIGLDEGVAGANIDDLRPTFIMPDDIDSREDSPVISESRFNVFTREVLPTRQANTLIYWAQNLISRFSVRYRIEKQHVRVLTDRKPTKPIPAVRGLVTELQTTDGIVQDVVVAGNPTWRIWDLQRVQDEINAYGLPAFLAECQHEVEQSVEGLMLHNWKDEVHVISESEFENVFGSRTMPKHWPKEWANDWARTKTKYHANVAAWRTVSPQNSPFPGAMFIFHPMSFPANSQPEDVAERVLTCLQPGPTHQLKTDYWDREVIVPAKPPILGMSWRELRRDELLRQNAVAHTETSLERLQYELDSLADVFPQYVEPTLRAHNVLGGLNSHERDDIRKIYGKVYGLSCRGINPKKFGGVEQINRDLQVDYNVDHPFRPQKGYSRMFVVVPDDKYAEPRNLPGDKVPVRPPKPFTDSIAPDKLEDDDLFRYQMVSWRTRPATVTATGEVIDDPEKMNDDYGNMWQFFAVAGPLRNVPLTIREELKTLIPHELTPEADIPMTHQRQQQMETARYFARETLREKYGEDLDDELEEHDLIGAFPI